MEQFVIEQGTPEWKAMRCGKITASRIKDMMAKTKSGPSASRKNLASTLMLERITGIVADSYTNAAMEWGVTNEPLARLAFSIATGLDVEEVPFVNHQTIERSGASPDGLVVESGLLGVLEIKCGHTATHVGWAIDGVVPQDHVLQLQWQMACTGARFGYFASFDPRMPEHQSLLVRKMPADDSMIYMLEQEVVKFDAEIEAMIADLEMVKWY